MMLRVSHSTEIVMVEDGTISDVAGMMASEGSLFVMRW